MAHLALFGLSASAPDAELGLKSPMGTPRPSATPVCGLMTKREPTSDDYWHDIFENLKIGFWATFIVLCLAAILEFLLQQ